MNRKVLLKVILVICVILLLGVCGFLLLRKDSPSEEKITQKSVFSKDDIVICSNSLMETDQYSYQYFYDIHENLNYVLYTFKTTQDYKDFTFYYDGNYEMKEDESELKKYFYLPYSFECSLEDINSCVQKIEKESDYHCYLNS